jgi:hypothetical protein
VADYPDEAVQRAAEVMLRQYETQYDAAHLTWRDFADDARAILGDAAPPLAEPYQDLLGSIHLCIPWRWVTSQLTTEQKELWADAVEAWSARLNTGTEETTTVDRWWRDA